MFYNKNSKKGGVKFTPPLEKEMERGLKLLTPFGERDRKGVNNFNPLWEG